MEKGENFKFFSFPKYIMNPQDEIIEIFRADAKDHLSVLNSFLLEMEKNPDPLPSFDAILRSIHTLKGDSRMVGLEEVGKVAHKIEDVLKAFLTGMVAPKEDRISALFDAVFYLENIIFGQIPSSASEMDEVLSGLDKAIAQKDIPQKATSRLMGKLSGLLGGVDAGPSPPAQSEEKPEGKPVSIPAKGPKEPEKNSSPSYRVNEEMLRIRSSSLDSILNLLGELTINREKITSLYFQLRNFLLPLIQSESTLLTEKKKKVLKEMLEDFYENTGDYFHLSSELQAHALEIRMIPVSTIFQEYPVMVRKIARDLGKKVELEIQGQDTQLDKTLLEAIRPALTHLLRNGLDHGIESPEERQGAGKNPQGVIFLKAYPKGNHVFIEIEDDGKGIDEQKILEKARERKIASGEKLDSLKREDLLNLIFIPGFTTKEIITDLSGRGIGMDVVATTVERLKGHVSVESEKGKFTRITLQLPMTLTIMQALLVTCSKEIVAIPLSFVQETQMLYPSQLQREGGFSVFSLRGTYVPIFHLSRILQFAEAVEKKEKYLVAILKFKEELLGVVVDRFLRQQEIVIKGMGDFLEGLALVSGATILRKGDPAIILNVYDVFQRLRYKQFESLDLEGDGAATRPEILVVDDSLTVRTVQKTVLENAGYIVDTAASGEEALKKTAHKIYSLVVTDVEMGEMDGFALTKNLREDSRYKVVPVVIVTSLAREQDRQKGLEAGAQAYIVKSSYDQRSLLDTIRSLIGLPG